MDLPTTADQELVLVVAASWNKLERRLDGALSNIKGISFAEYRLLRALADSPGEAASRVELADAVGRTPSGVTRALRPLEKLGFVTTVRSERDARKALATLSEEGAELVSDASGVVNDTAAELLAKASTVRQQRPLLITLLAELSA